MEPFQYRTLSPKELADVVGVSESSIKRWVDSGLIQVARTAGGHRRIPLSEALHFIRTRGMRVLHPERLGVPDLEQLPQEAYWGKLTGELLYGSLYHGEAARARGMLSAAYLNGTALADLCDGPISEALGRLGEMWAYDERGIYHEHAATTVCLEAVDQIRLLIPPPPPGAPVALGGSPEHDPYLLPNLMASAVLTDAGFHTVNIGAHTPTQTFLHAVEANRPSLVWVALTSDLPDAHWKRLEPLFNGLAGAPPEVVVGGRTAEALRDRFPPSVRVLDSMAALARHAARFVEEG